MVSCMPSSVSQKLIHILLFFQLTELVPEFLKLHVDTILQMLLAGCADSSQDVASSAISAATTLISVLSDEEEVMKLQPLLTPILEVVNRSLQLGLEDIVIEAFDMFQECAAMSQPLINDHIAVGTHTDCIHFLLLHACVSLISFL